MFKFVVNCQIIQKPLALASMKINQTSKKVHRVYELSKGQALNTDQLVSTYKML